MKAVSLIGDIKGSRHIPSEERALFQRNFLAEIQSTTSAPWRKKGDLASPFTVTLGDEFQAVYRDPEFVVADCWALWAALGSRRLRISLGVGNITTELNPRAAIGMDGPAFYAARHTLEMLKEKDQCFAVGSEAGPIDELSAYAALIGAITERLNTRQLLILTGLIEGLNQARIAARLEISPQAVSKSIDRHALAELACAGRELGVGLARRIGAVA